VRFHAAPALHAMSNAQRAAPRDLLDDKAFQSKPTRYSHRRRNESIGETVVATQDRSGRCCPRAPSAFSDPTPQRLCGPRAGGTGRGCYPRNLSRRSAGTRCCPNPPFATWHRDHAAEAVTLCAETLKLSLLLNVQALSAARAERDGKQLKRPRVGPMRASREPKHPRCVGLTPACELYDDGSES
jgi:hypothetical protein